MLVEFTVAYREKWMQWMLFMSMPQRPHTVFETCVRVLHAAGNETAVHCELMAQSSSFQKPQKPLYICQWSKFCKWNMFQVYIISSLGVQRVSIFCSKIGFRGSLFIEKLVSGEPYGSIFTITGMTDLTSTQLALVGLVAVLQQEAGNNPHQRFKTQTFKS